MRSAAVAGACETRMAATARMEAGRVFKALL
jgi:hypothetical protein